MPNELEISTLSDYLSVTEQMPWSIRMRFPLRFLSRLSRDSLWSRQYSVRITHHFLPRSTRWRTQLKDADFHHLIEEFVLKKSCTQSFYWSWFLTGIKRFVRARRLKQFATELPIGDNQFNWLNLADSIQRIQFNKFNAASSIVNKRLW